MLNMLTIRVLLHTHASSICEFLQYILEVSWYVSTFAEIL